MHKSVPRNQRRTCRKRQREGGGGGGQREKMWVRKKKVGESINHSYAPVRVASGTNRNHMQRDNIPNFRLAGQVQCEPALLLSQPSNNLLHPRPLDPEEMGHPPYAAQTLHLPSSRPEDSIIIIIIISPSMQVTFTLHEAGNVCR